MKKSEVKLLSTIIEQLKEEVPDNIYRIGVTELWKQGYTGSGVVIAVLDTGCDVEQLDLKERIIGGYNFTKELNGDVHKWVDLNGHGTHTAGTIAASSNNSGIVGVAPDVKLLILKVLDKHGNGSVKSLVEAIEYAIVWQGPNGEKVNILSMSLGVSSPEENLYKAIKNAVAHNIAVVVAAGNEGDGNLKTSEYSYPAGFKEVIAVGAIDHNNKVANFSNTNKEVDIYAPGVDIKSTYINNGYMELSGTSMATPHVAGALALLINKYENLKNTKPTEKQLFDYLMAHTSNVYLSEYGQTVHVLDLTKASSKNINNTLLLKCFCEARKSQAFFTRCLDDSLTEKERALLHSLIQESASRANQIKYLCQEFN